MTRSRRASAHDPESIRKRVASLLEGFEKDLQSGDLRRKVLALVPVFKTLRDLGKSLVPLESGTAARDRILFYLQRYPGKVIQGDELLVVSGIQEYARRLRELRVQAGWSIVSGLTMKESIDQESGDYPDEYINMRPDDYVLLRMDPDRDAAHRWFTANSIRKSGGPVRDRILAFLRESVGRGVTGEELRYVANNKTEWARRVRELRTEHGWPVVTRSTGRPDLPVGVYVLEADRQSPEHDRNIPDEVRGEVLRRDRYQCKHCRWTHKLWNRSDPRHLELHHAKEHVSGGSNEPGNLITLCTVCHDVVHRTRPSKRR